MPHVTTLTTQTDAQSARELMRLRPMSAGERRVMRAMTCTATALMAVVAIPAAAVVMAALVASGVVSGVRALAPASV